jgi:hypothetical protein
MIARTNWIEQQAAAAHREAILEIERDIADLRRQSLRSARGAYVASWLVLACYVGGMTLTRGTAAYYVFGGAAIIGAMTVYRTYRRLQYTKQVLRSYQ